jgi:hypothetical protein
MSDYTIESFVGVGMLKFGMPRAQVHVLLGNPPRSRKSKFSEGVTDFWNENGLQLAFSDSRGQLREIGLYPNLPKVELGSLNLFDRPGKEVLQKLCELDGSPRITVGVVVLLQLGIAVSGFLVEDGDERSVTAFARGVWQSNNPKLLAYKFK